MLLDCFMKRLPLDRIAARMRGQVISATAFCPWSDDWRTRTALNFFIIQVPGFLGLGLISITIFQLCTARLACVWEKGWAVVCINS